MRTKIVKIVLLIIIVIMSSMLLNSCIPKTAQEEYELLISNKLPVNIVYALFIYDNYRLETAIGNADYVFVGKVEDYLYTITDTPGLCTKTVYSVSVLENIKGNLVTNQAIEIIKDGGLSRDYKYKYLYEDDEFPLIGEYYIFLLCVFDEKGNLDAFGRNTNLRIENKNDYTIDSEYIRVVQAYEQEEVYERTRFKSKYERV